MSDTSTAPASSDQETPPLRPFQDLRTAGLLWLINHRLLHPRGVALSLYTDAEGQATGWNLLRSPDGKPWTFDAETNQDGRARAEDTLTTSGALPAHQEPELPPFTGNAALCPKCGYEFVSTGYRRALSATTMLRTGGRLVRGPLPERQERDCDRCHYTWDEAVAVGGEPELPVPLTARELAYALDNSTPYPVELHPEVAAVMASNLTQMLSAYPRPGHVVWSAEEDDEPEAVRPAPETPPGQDEVAGLEDLPPKRAALVRAVHQSTRELEDAHAHHLAPGITPQAGQDARRVLRATALRLRRGEDAEAVLLATITALAHVLAGGDGISSHTLTGIDE